MQTCRDHMKDANML